MERAQTTEAVGLWTTETKMKYSQIVWKGKTKRVKSP